MEKDIAFDLNERLQQWRSALRNRPAIREEDIEELESHLSDTIDVLLKNGLSAEEAFLVGARRVGHPVELEEQFRCARPAAVWQERAQWMVVGILAWWVVSGLMEVGSSLMLWLGGGLSGNGLALGWTSLAVQALLIFGFGWLACGRITRVIRPLAARWIIYLSVGTIVLGISATLMQAIAIRETEPRVFGMYLTVTMWGTAVLSRAIVIAAGLWLVSSVRLKSAGGIAVLLIAGLLVGCGQSGESTNPSASARRAAGFESCLELINRDANAAVEAFLELDLAQGQLFAPGSALAYSESEFVNLPAAAREKLGQQALADLEPVKRLATEVRSRRNAARTAGDTALAEKCNAQLARLGERLEGPDNLKLTQLVGKAVSRMASE
jgi:hypothetical protein